MKLVLPESFKSEAVFAVHPLVLKHILSPLPYFILDMRISRSFDWKQQAGGGDMVRQGYIPGKQGYTPGKQGYTPGKQGYLPSESGFLPKIVPPNRSGLALPVKEKMAKINVPRTRFPALDKEVSCNSCFQFLDESLQFN